MQLQFLGRVFNKLHLKSIGLAFNKFLKCNCIDKIDKEYALSLLSKECPDNGKSSLTQNEIHINQGYDVQVIMPAYNAESTIREAIESVISQKSDCKILLTVVNDGSTDNTGKILAEYVSRDDIKIIDQSNLGHSGARNAALKHIKAPYITFIDSDDCLAKDAIRNLYDAAISTGASIVQGSYVTINPNGDLRRSIIMPNKYNDGKILGFPWGKLFKAEIFRNIQFPEGYWFEDTLLSALIVPLIPPEKKVSISDIVYKYRVNPSGITATAKTKPKVVDSLWVCRKLYEDRDRIGKPMRTEEYPQFLRQCMTTLSRINSYNNGSLTPYAMRCLQGFRERWFRDAKAPDSDYRYVHKALISGNTNSMLFLSGLLS